MEVKQEARAAEIHAARRKAREEEAFKGLSLIEDFIDAKISGDEGRISVTRKALLDELSSV